MSDSQSQRKRPVLFWIGCVALVGFTAGVAAAAMPAVAPFVRPALAAVCILAGLVLVSPFATSRPVNEPQRKARLRISVIGAALMVYGAALALADDKARLTLMILTVLLMAAAASGLPRRLFGPRP